MKSYRILYLLASTPIALSSSIPSRDLARVPSEASLSKRGGPPCNIEGCLGAVAGAVGGALACLLAAEGAIACEVPVITGGVIGTLTACAGCTVIPKCDPGDQTAVDNACVSSSDPNRKRSKILADDYFPQGTPDAAKAELGPNQCLQRSTSVLHPSNTDHVLGDFTMHCHNTAKVVSNSFGACGFPCANCTQCAGWPN